MTKRKSKDNYPLTELMNYLAQCDINYNYDFNDNAIIIEFAEKEQDSIHDVDFKSIEITYDEHVTKRFTVSFYTYFNKKDYPELPPSHVVRMSYTTDPTYLLLLASSLKYYINATESQLNIIDVIKTNSQEKE